MAYRPSYNTGYQGFQPGSVRLPETLKPGETRHTRDSKFSSVGRGVLATQRVASNRDPFSTTSGLATCQVTKQHYKLPNRRGVMAEVDARSVPTKEFLAVSSHHESFPNHMADITVVTERSDADFRDAFDRQDADRSGQVDKRQLRALLADALGREPGELHLIKFSAALARTKSGRFTWDDLQAALTNVRGQLRSMLPGFRTRHTLPVWMASSEARVLPRGEICSTTHRDMGKYGERPTDRPLVAGTGMFSTSAELCEGTSKASWHLPGYGGFIPGSRSSSRAEAGEEAPALRDVMKQSVRTTFKLNAPGYTGHVPRAAACDNGPRKPSRATSTGATYAEVERLWEARREAQKARQAP